MVKISMYVAEAVTIEYIIDRKTAGLCVIAIFLSNFLVYMELRLNSVLHNGSSIQFDGVYSTLFIFIEIEAE